MLPMRELHRGHTAATAFLLLVVGVFLLALITVTSASGPERYARAQHEVDAASQTSSAAGGHDGQDDIQVQADSSGKRRRNRDRSPKQSRRQAILQAKQQQQEEAEEAAAAAEEMEEGDDYYAETRVMHAASPQQEGHTRQDEDDDEGEEDDEYDMGYYSNVTEQAENGNCSHCPYLETIKAYKLEILKRKILRKLRLKKPPKRPPGDLPNILNFTFPDTSEPATEPSGGSAYDDEDESVTQKILIMGQKPPEKLGLENMESRFPLMMANLLYFHFADDLLHFKISSAQLNIYLRATNKSAESSQETQLLIYRLQQNRHNRRLTRHLLNKKTIRLDNSDTGTWHYFPFAHEVNLWLKKPQENFGLEIQAQDSDGFPLAILQPAQGDVEYGKRPLLDIKIEEDNNSRSKRMVSTRLDCTNGKQTPYCCRYNLVADFDAIGWDFIIQPRQYMAFYCAGDCPYYFNPATGHSHMYRVAQDNQQTRSRHNSIAGPCCTGVRVAPLNMIYFDNNKNIRYGRLRDMMVLECACA